MAPNQKTPDITIRGGLINVPDSAKPQPIPRHQPDTPPTKKKTKIRPDHQVPPTVAPRPPDPDPDESQGDQTNVSTPPSESH